MHESAFILAKIVPKLCRRHFDEASTTTLPKKCGYVVPAAEDRAVRTGDLRKRADLAVVAVGSHMIQTAFDLDARLSCHSGKDRNLGKAIWSIKELQIYRSDAMKLVSSS